MMATTAVEAVGLIKGLAEIVKLQWTTQATRQSDTKTQLQQLSDTMHDLSQVIKTTQTKSTPQQAFRLPDLILPEFSSLDVKILTGVWIECQLCYRLQACHHRHSLNNTVTVMYVHMMPFQMLKRNNLLPVWDSIHRKQLLMILSSITKHAWARSKKNAGNRKDQKIRDLLPPSHTMQQGKNKPVPDFAHRF